MPGDSFGSRGSLRVGDRTYTIWRLGALERAGIDLARLPYSLRVLLESLLRLEDGVVYKAADVEAVGRWDPRAAPSHEIAFMPARVLLQDFTGVPAVVDLASMRDAMRALGDYPCAPSPDRIAPDDAGSGRRFDGDSSCADFAVGRSSCTRAHNKQRRYNR